MNRTFMLAVLACCILFLCGCSGMPGQLGLETISQQLETMASQIDVEAIVNEVVERIDWEELKSCAQEGYDALTETYPALKGENIQAFLKDNGLELVKKYLQSADEGRQENARKLGEILRILNPELADEVDAVITK